MTEHATEIAYSETRVRLPWEARCSCGWVSRAYKHHYQAKNAGEKHPAPADKTVPAWDLMAHDEIVDPNGNLEVSQVARYGTATGERYVRVNVTGEAERLGRPVRFGESWEFDADDLVRVIRR